MALNYLKSHWNLNITLSLLLDADYPREGKIVSIAFENSASISMECFFEQHNCLRRVEVNFSKLKLIRRFVCFSWKLFVRRLHSLFEIVFKVIHSGQSSSCSNQNEKLKFYSMSANENWTQTFRFFTIIGGMTFNSSTRLNCLRSPSKVHYQKRRKVCLLLCFCCEWKYLRCDNIKFHQHLPSSCFFWYWNCRFPSVRESKTFCENENGFPELHGRFENISRVLFYIFCCLSCSKMRERHEHTEGEIISARHQHSFTTQIDRIELWLHFGAHTQTERFSFFFSSPQTAFFFPEMFQ